MLCIQTLTCIYYIAYVRTKWALILSPISSFRGPQYTTHTYFHFFFSIASFLLSQLYSSCLLLSLLLLLSISPIACSLIIGCNCVQYIKSVVPRLALSAAARLDSCSSTINMSTGFSLGSFSFSVAHFTLSIQQWHTTLQKSLAFVWLCVLL